MQKYNKINLIILNMNTNILFSAINHIFSCFKNNEKKELKDIIDSQILLNIGLELEPELFIPLKTSLTFDKNYGILMVELTEIKNILIKILEISDFKPNEKFNEIKNIDSLTLAKYNENEIIKLLKIIALDIFFCSEKANLIDIIDKLDENEQNELYEILQMNVKFDDENERNTIRQTIRETIRPSYYRESVQSNNMLNYSLDRNTITADFSINDSFHQRIKMLEEELSKEIEKNKILESIKKKNTKLETEKIELKSQVSSLNTQKDFLKKVNEVNEEKIDKLTKENAKVKELKELLEETKKKNKELIEENEKLKNEENIINTKLKDCEQKINSQNEYINDMKIRLEDSQKKYDKVVQNLKIANEKLKQSLLNEKNNGITKEAYQILNTKVETLNINLKEKDEIIEKLRKDLEKSNLIINYMKKNNNNNKNNENDEKINEEKKDLFNSKTMNTFNLNNNNTLELNNNKIQINQNIKIEEVNNNKNKINESFIEYIEKIKVLQEEVQKEQMMKEMIKLEYENDKMKYKEKTEKEFNLISGCMYKVATEHFHLKILLDNYLRLYGNIDKKGLLKIEKNRKYGKKIYGEII